MHRRTTRSGAGRPLRTMPLSAARVQGQLAGLNRHEVLDDDDPRRLIAVRRVQPRRAATTAPSSSRMHSLAHAARRTSAQTFVDAYNVPQRPETIEASRLHSCRFGSLWKISGPNIERYCCNADPRPRKCLVSTIRLLKNSFPPQFDSVPDSIGFLSVHGFNHAGWTFSTACYCAGAPLGLGRSSCTDSGPFSTTIERNPIPRINQPLFSSPTRSRKTASASDP